MLLQRQVVFLRTLLISRDAWRMDKYALMQCFIRCWAHLLVNCLIQTSFLYYIRKIAESHYRTHCADVALVDVALLLFACALCSIVVCASERNTVMYSTYVLLSDRIRTCASPVSDLICDSMSRASADQKRADALKYRCYGGYGGKDHEKKNLIIEPQALKEWEELLPKRFAQERSGGASFVVEILDIIKSPMIGGLRSPSSFIEGFLGDLKPES